MCLTYQWSVGIPSGVPLDSSNNSTNFTLDDVDILVHLAAFLREKQRRGWLVLAEPYIAYSPSIQVYYKKNSHIKISWFTVVSSNRLYFSKICPSITSEVPKIHCFFNMLFCYGVFWSVFNVCHSPISWNRYASIC